MTEITGSAAEAELQSTAAEHLLLSLSRHGIQHVFSNLGTDHTPILEAHARLTEAGMGDDIPEILICQHEFVAMSAAQGYAASTGEPQAVLVHVDVGTQNLGASMHNAHRAEVPILVMAGLAPVSDRGHLGSRDHAVHYFQDVFDQPGIVEEYCRWTGEYQPPADPDALVARALDRATGARPGPTYLAASREALETTIESPRLNRTVRTARPSVPTDPVLDDIAGALEHASAPVVITSGYDGDIETFRQFAETAGAAVIESFPTRLCFPRDHDLHAGFDATNALERADCILLVDTHVPWIPAEVQPHEDASIFQIDAEPTKSTYPHWDFPLDERIAADAEATLAALTGRIDSKSGRDARASWTTFATDRREDLEQAVRDDRAAGRLTPDVLTAAVDDILDESSIVIEDAVSNGGAVKRHLQLGERNGYFWKGGSGLGWAGGSAVGAKMAHPDKLVVALVGDGSYLFSHPSISALFGASLEAPTLTVIYNNRGWRAVKTAVRAQHPDGDAMRDGRTHSAFEPSPDLTKPATVVDAHTNSVDAIGELQAALSEAKQAVAEGRPAVVDVRLDQSAG